jgi:hypothetical protein
MQDVGRNVEIVTGVNDIPILELIAGHSSSSPPLTI